MTTPAEHVFAEAAWGDTEPAPYTWRSGQWWVEVRGDELADVRFGRRLVLRAIRAVARDRNWATVPVRVLQTTASERELLLDLEFRGFGGHITGRLSVAAERNSLRVEFTAASHTDFLRNRIGLVVLHPPSVAGARLSVSTADGRTNEGRFPELISPHQLAFDITRMEWLSEGMASSLDFDGDVFEMEDQRNWTDASFKTYSTPLSRPFPVQVRAGDQINQSLVLRCQVISAPAARVGKALLRLEESGATVPSVSIGASTAPDPSPDLEPPTADALLVEVDLTTTIWRATLDRADHDAGGTPLDVRIVSEPSIDLKDVAAAIESLDVVRVGIYDKITHVTEPELWRALRAAFPSRELVGGVRSHFTELNRNHTRLSANVPALTFSVTPQMHATERAQLVESVAMLHQVVLNAAQIAGKRPIHVGPITLRPRFNAVATVLPPPSSDLSVGYGAELIDATDPRQSSTALVAWTVAAAVALWVPGVASVAWFEQWGRRGIFGPDGVPYPVANALMWLHEISGLPMLVDQEPGRDGLWVVGARRGSELILLAANLVPRRQEVRVSLPDGRQDVLIGLQGLSAERLIVPL